MEEAKRPDPGPFFLDGGPVGALLIHGFTGAPPEMRLVGDYLHQRGLTISGPLLPGHGTTAADLNRRQWTEWVDHAEEALGELRRRCESVFVGGLSMGSLVTLCLAAQHPELPGAIVYSSPVLIREWRAYAAPLLKYVIPIIRKPRRNTLTDPQARELLWYYNEYPVRAAHEVLKLARRARRLLGRVSCPLLAIHTTLDHYVHHRSLQYILDRVASKESEGIMLANSGHALTVDSEWEFVAEKTYRFIQAYSSPSPS
ncbi:MAG: alpha/beta fold hydrolase [Anaerolineales bacterium]|nr:MAG: alpha/beta fold hydrolase [Anaerolineales bacterium]